MSKKTKSKQFTESLVKGRIAETIFERMLLATEKYTVLKGGYERILSVKTYKRSIWVF